MARRWTKAEEGRFRAELRQLYVVQNKSIKEVGELLGISDKAVYDRLIRLDIKTQRHKKAGYNKQRHDIRFPQRSKTFAEFLGTMLGDGHVSHFQVIVTLGTKEVSYVHHVAQCMGALFGVKAKTLFRKTGYRDVYINSVALTCWLKTQGLVSNKVREQVGAPKWIFKKPTYMKAFLRGFFDTDGSIYCLKFGIQISLTNHSLPLLHDLRIMLKMLGYKPSEISLFRVYLTQRTEVERFFKEIAPANTKHQTRFRKFMRRSDSGNSRRL